MRKVFFVVLAMVVFCLSAGAQVNKIIGRWKTIDDKDGSVKSIVLIYRASNGVYYGKIEKLFKDPSKICAECEGENKNKPVVGLVIIAGMTEKDNALTGGTILDPKDGKVYKCNISFDEKSSNLKVRGSLDKSGWFGRTQYWIRVS